MGMGGGRRAALWMIYELYLFYFHFCVVLILASI